MDLAFESFRVDKDSKMESEMIEEVNFAEEYSVEGWVKFGKIKGLQKRVIFRLTTNEVQKDIDLGDRALAVFQNEDSFKFGTYSLQGTVPFLILLRCGPLRQPEGQPPEIGEVRS